MDSELDLLLGTAINSLVKLEILLHLQHRPGAAETAEQLGTSLHRSARVVGPALEELSEMGLVERFALGTGRHVMYGSPEDKHANDVLDRLYEEYHRDGGSKGRLIGRVVGADSGNDAAGDGG